MEPTAIDKEKEKISKLYASFDAEKTACSERMKGMIGSASSLSEISDGQVLMLSFRHEITDKMMDMRKMRYKKQMTVDKMFNQLYDKYKREGYKNMKLNRDELIEYIKTELSYLYEQLEIMDMFIFYYQKLVETLDKLGFVFKNKIDLEKM